MVENSFKNKSKIVFTGGGSGGHVFPNKPLMDYYKNDFDIIYIGTKNGVERDIVSTWGVKYKAISAGKLRRYFDIQNFFDLFKFCFGLLQAIIFLKINRPKFIFSKGGFVSVPVCIAGKLLGIPVYIHEADMTPGLANKIASRFATKVFLTFNPKVKPSFPYVVSGLPMRSEIYTTSLYNAKNFLGVSNNTKPILLVLGGSLGASNINALVRENLELLLFSFTVVHSTGVGKSDPTISREGYIQKEFIKDEIFDCIALADVVVSRAGANGMMELLTLKKPTLFIPLGLDQSRGDQIQNCEFITENSLGVVIEEASLTNKIFVDTLHKIYQDKNKYISNIEKVNLPNAVKAITSEIGIK